MARMIPPQMPRGTASAAEKEVFHRLQEDPGTEGWFVLHSLDVAEHLRNVMGEIDFVIIVPHLGVLCLEVKGSRHLTRHDGLWYYGPDAKPDPRGPFKQASEAMHSLRRRLIRKAPELDHVVFYSAVLFPNVEFKDDSPEWFRWQVIDTHMFHRHPISKLCRHVLEKGRQRLAQIPTARWFDPKSPSPTARECERIAQVLRGDFEYFEPPKIRIERWQEEVKRYTEEQFEALDNMEANTRVIFKGPAGTGKTLLAVEAARRSATQGERVLLVCFNRLLAQWLKEQLSDHPLIKVGTIHSYMLEVAGETVPKGAGPDFWQETLPLMALDRLLHEEHEPFDALIMDEGQDLLNDNFLDVLDASLRGGLAAGKCRMFGDFDHQTIFDASKITLEDFKQRCGAEVPIFALRINCRNAPRIASLGEELGDLRPGYFRVLRPDNEIDPTVDFFSSLEDQAARLVRVLASLMDEGFQPQDIVVLSPRSEENCVAAQVEDQSLRRSMAPISRSGDKDQAGKIRYGSIYAFKGMEAPAVVLTDVHELEEQGARDLFYVGATRALHRLVLLVDAKLKGRVQRMLKAAGNG